jgi:peptidoglycan/LPS O-acetylase OafA/YrhL
MTVKKAEIQGLRALAVISVVCFHIWPDLIPGGYIGVDVFFVISGYLITGLLCREIIKYQTISLTNFYVRRIRRLLPAATAVLLAVVFALPLLPEAHWEDTAWEIAASALYVENWRLAWLSVDYLGAENAPSPIQHYWSLSVEEQFYIFWPLVMIAGAWVAKRTGRLQSVLLGSLVIIAAASFAASVFLTRNNPEAAYFVTHTRIWELSLGGLLALIALPRLPPVISEGMRLAGLGLIIWACFVFSGTTAFPGYAALMPTLGCALVIAAGPSHSGWSSYRLLAAQPAQFLGDISYSLYLWHWPLIVFASIYTLEPRLGSLAGAGVFTLAVLISSFSKRYVEDPFRASTNPFTTTALGASSIATCVLAALAILGVVNVQGSRISASQDTLQQYPGAAVLLAGASTPKVKELLPPLTAIRKDLPDAYRLGCHLGIPETKLNPCVFGNREASFHIALVGDSHAANWIPALEELSRTNDWFVETHTKSGCPVLQEVVSLRGKPYKACLEWGQNILKHIAASKPDAVLFAQSAGVVLHEQAKSIDADLVKTWRSLMAAGVQVIAIADTPRHEVDPSQCIKLNPECASDRSSALRSDPIIRAQKTESGVAMINMNDTVCTETACPMVIGNIIAWRDNHHLTATYARNLAPILGKRILASQERWLHN